MSTEEIQKPIRDKEYFARKVRESYRRNKPYYCVVINNTHYLFSKDKIQRIKPKELSSIPFYKILS